MRRQRVSTQGARWLVRQHSRLDEGPVRRRIGQSPRRDVEVDEVIDLPRELAIDRHRRRIQVPSAVCHFTPSAAPAEPWNAAAPGAAPHSRGGLFVWHECAMCFRSRAIAGLTTPEIIALIGCLRVHGSGVANAGVLTEVVCTVSHDFFVHLLDMCARRVATTAAKHTFEKAIKKRLYLFRQTRGIHRASRLRQELLQAITKAHRRLCPRSICRPPCQYRTPEATTW